MPTCATSPESVDSSSIAIARTPSISRITSVMVVMIS